MTKEILPTLWDAVGNTPLIELPTLSRQTGCRILVKLEFMNPGGSVKDRAAKWMIDRALKEGVLKPGGTIVEGTAGNTGIGLSVLGRARGFRVLISMPDNQSPEKYKYLQAVGAELDLGPAVAFANEDHFYHRARRKAAEIPGAVWMDQFENTANSQAHYCSTGPEIWNATQGQIDQFVCAAGTGGTISGVSRFLKEKHPRVRITLADPMGSGLYEYLRTGTIKAEGSSVTEGIGIMRITENFRQAQIDEAIRITDREAVDTLKLVAREEGLFVGLSSALNIAAAVQLASRTENRNTGQTFVTLVCDHGTRYQSRLLDSEWMASKGLKERQS